MPTDISSMRTKYEVKRKNRFFLIFPLDVGGASLQASVLGSNRPNWKVSEQTLEHLNTKWYLSGKPDWDTWDCTFYDYVDDNTLKAMFTWYNLVYNPTTTLMSVPSVYKKDIIIQMLGPELEDDIVEQYTLYGAWPMSIAGGDLSMDAQGDVMNIAVTFRYDYAILNA